MALLGCLTFARGMGWFWGAGKSIWGNAKCGVLPVFLAIAPHFQPVYKVISHNTTPKSQHINLSHLPARYATSKYGSTKPRFHRLAYLSYLHDTFPLPHGNALYAVAHTPCDVTPPNIYGLLSINRYDRYATPKIPLHIATLSLAYLLAYLLKV